MLEVTPIKAFSDNYIWCLRQPGGREAWLVDPGDGAAAAEGLAALGLELGGILITHHHWDHTGGLDDLLALGSVPVFGPRNPAIGPITRRLAEGDRATALGVEFQVLEVPGHTLDHIAFYAPLPTPLLFCGDTLFAGGCGRLFEGDAPTMHQSLSKLAALPPETQVYCAHEYTLANLAFAQAVEPDNPELAARMNRDQATRKRNEPTVPSTIATELATNPFLRCGETTVAQAAARQHKKLNTQDAIAVFAAVREWKDGF